MNYENFSSPFRDKGAIGNFARKLIRSIRLLKIYLLSPGKITTGINFSIGKGGDIRPANFFRCGNFVGIGKNFTCEADAQIGDHVLISSNVAFISDDHLFDNPNSNVFMQGRKPPALIVLEGDNLIGFGAIIIGPCTIEKGAIIGAGAIAKGRIPSYSICTGTPARKIKDRFKPNGVPS